MKPIIFKEAKKIWETLTKKIEDEELKFDLEIHKKLLNIFQIGDFYYYIFNLKTSLFDFVSEDIYRVLGYHAKDVTVPFIMSKIHPDDQPWFLNFESKVVEFFSSLKPEQIPNYKVSYDYRICKNNSEYIRVHQQVITIQFGEGNQLLRTFGVHTDISNYKKEGKPSLSFIGLNNEPSYYNVAVDNVFGKSKNSLTKRELQILKLLIQGKNSQTISEELFISKQTVDSHRKALRLKTKTKNTASLISYAINQGLI